MIMTNLKKISVIAQRIPSSRTTNSLPWIYLPSFFPTRITFLHANPQVLYYHCVNFHQYLFTHWISSCAYKKYGWTDSDSYIPQNYFVCGGSSVGFRQETELRLLFSEDLTLTNPKQTFKTTKYCPLKPATPVSLIHACNS